MELVRGTAVLWRGPGVLQVGADPDHHVVLEGLTASEQAWLLEAARAAMPVDPLLAPAPTGPRTPLVPPPGALRLRARLEAVGLVDATRSGTLPGSGAAADAPGPGVVLDGLDAVTLAAADLLAQAGVRRFQVVDARQVDSSLEGAVPSGTYGYPRTAVAQDLLTSRYRDVYVGPLADPDVVVVSRARTPDVASTGLLMAEDRPHVTVTLRERHVEVGPLVLPGLTPCAHCRSLDLTDRDGLWPVMAQEMADWPLPAPTTAARVQASLEVARAVLEATGVATLGPSSLSGPGWAVCRVDADGTSRLVPLAPHPRCGCGATGEPFLPAASPASRRHDRAPAVGPAA